MAMKRLVLSVLFVCLYASPAFAPPPGKEKKETLGGLSCTTDQIAKWDGAKWACAPDEAGAAGDQILQDQIDALQAEIDALPPDDGIGVPVIRDVTGALVGTILGFSGSFAAGAAVVHHGDPNKSAFFDVFPRIVLSVTGTGFHPVSTIVQDTHIHTRNNGTAANVP